MAELKNIIQDDVALPSQFDRLWHHSRALSAEKSLALAVMEQAIDDLNKFRFARRRDLQMIYWDTYDWVSSNDRRWPYSFVRLCDGLGLEVEITRTTLLSIQPRPTSVSLAQAA